MNNYSWKKHYAIKSEFDEKNNWIPERPGIYLWTRYDADINKTYFYVGQAESLRNRRFDYEKVLTGLKWPEGHFQSSLKAHKDWKYQIICECKLEELDELEKKYIHEYKCKDNYITRNTQHGDSDIVRTNFNRINRIKKEYEQATQKCLNNLDVIEVEGKALSIAIKHNKDGSLTKRSQDSYKTLKERLGITNDN